MSFFSDASPGTIAVVVAGTLLWTFAGVLHVRARALEQHARTDGSPLRPDFGVRRLRLLELLGLAMMIGGLV